MKTLLRLIICALVIALLLPKLFLGNQAFASPAFGYTTLINNYHAWILEVPPKNSTSQAGTKVQGDNSTDILTVAYLSDGRTLNATIWVAGKFDSNQPSNNSDVYSKSYGMLFDSDFDNIIDYRAEIQKFKNVPWTYSVREYEPAYPLHLNIDIGERRFLKLQNNYTGFFQNGQRYIHLSVDLHSIGSPDKYKVLFYAREVKEDGSFITDYTKWVYIPPPEFFISSLPNPLILRAGEQKPITLELNSSTGFQPVVRFYAKAQPGIEVNSISNQIQIPSYGIATIPLMVKVSRNTEPASYAVPIIANGTIAPESVFGSSNNNSSANVDLVPHGQKSENIFKTSTLSIIVQEPLTFEEQILDLLNKWQFVISFITGLLTGQAGLWLFRKINTRLKRK